jgi:hypothetical protein
MSWPSGTPNAPNDGTKATLATMVTMALAIVTRPISLARPSRERRRDDSADRDDHTNAGEQHEARGPPAASGPCR